MPGLRRVRSRQLPRGTGAAPPNPGAGFASLVRRSLLGGTRSPWRAEVIESNRSRGVPPALLAYPRAERARWGATFRPSAPDRVRVRDVGEPHLANGQVPAVVVGDGDSPELLRPTALHRLGGR